MVVRPESVASVPSPSPSRAHDSSHSSPTYSSRASRESCWPASVDVLTAALVWDCLTQRCPYEKHLESPTWLSLEHHSLWLLGTTIFFFNLIHVFIYWNIIALPYCISFCFTTTWILFTNTYPLSLLSLPPTPGYYYLTPLPALGPPLLLGSPTQASGWSPVWFVFLNNF